MGKTPRVYLLCVQPVEPLPDLGLRSSEMEGNPSTTVRSNQYGEEVVEITLVQQLLCLGLVIHPKVAQEANVERLLFLWRPQGLAMSPEVSSSVASMPVKLKLPPHDLL